MDYVDPILLEKNMQPGGRNDVLFQMNDAVQKSKIIARKRAEQQEKEILGETGMIRKSKLVNTSFFGNQTELVFLGYFSWGFLVSFLGGFLQGPKKYKGTG